MLSILGVMAASFGSLPCSQRICWGHYRRLAAQSLRCSDEWGSADGSSGRLAAQSLRCNDEWGSADASAFLHCLRTDSEGYSGDLTNACAAPRMWVDCATGKNMMQQ